MYIEKENVEKFQNMCDFVMAEVNVHVFQIKMCPWSSDYNMLVFI